MTRHLPLFLLLLLLGSCTEPVVPEYDFEDGFLLVEGRLTDVPGQSQITVSRSEVVLEFYTLNPEAEVSVTVEDDRGNSVVFPEVFPGTYLAPPSFAVEPGRSYTAELTTRQGEVLTSAPERTPNAVPLDALSFRFEQEAFFDNDRDRFVPAITVLADFQDPAGQRNFYRWRTTLYQQLEICATCVNGFWRPGGCRPGGGQTYDYLCDGFCWGISRGDRLFQFSDERADGSAITGQPVAQIEFSRRGGLLVVVEQQSVTAGANAYDLARLDLTENSGGLNAPLPAPLVGNLSGREADGASIPVLGYVGVELSTEARLFIDRDEIDGIPSRTPPIPNLEPVIPEPPRAPCEGPFRTAEEPEGWQN